MGERTEPGAGAARARSHAPPLPDPEAGAASPLASHRTVTQPADDGADADTTVGEDALSPSLAGLSPRQRRILELVEARGFVTVEDLAQTFNVSTQTVRRDIIGLDSAALLQRFHGGAGKSDESQTLRLGYERKRSASVAQKRTIAERAALKVSDGDYVFLDVGTTVEAAAAELNAKSELTVFTNSMRAASQLDPGRHTVHVLGGLVRGKDGSLVGEEAVERLRGLRLDVALIGCSGIEADGTVLDFDLQKIAIKTAAMGAARCKLLLATHAKFGRAARARVARIADFDAVLTDEDEPA